MRPDNSYPEPTPDNPTPMPMERRFDLAPFFIGCVSAALKMMFVEHLEVPYLWHYKRDAFSILENQGQSSVQFLERDELWTLYTLGLRFRAIYDRCEQIKTMWGKIKAKKPELENEYLTKTLVASICMMSVEAAAEGYDWLGYHYPEEMRQIKEEEAIEEGLKRLPEKSRVEESRSGPIMELVKVSCAQQEYWSRLTSCRRMGSTSPKLQSHSTTQRGTQIRRRTPLAYLSSWPRSLQETEQSSLMPWRHCQVGAIVTYRVKSDHIAAASQIIVSEMAKDPSIRQQARDFVEACGVVSVTPTERGQTIIDEYHIYHVSISRRPLPKSYADDIPQTFKFLTDKPIAMFKDSPEFLHMLKAEEDGLIEIDIAVGEMESSFTDTLIRCVRSNDYGEISTEWNKLRQEICETVVSQHLIPAAAKWAKEHMKGQAEEFVAERCRMELEFVNRSILSEGVPTDKYSASTFDPLPTRRWSRVIHHPSWPLPMVEEGCATLSLLSSSTTMAISAHKPNSITSRKTPNETHSWSWWKSRNRALWLSVVSQCSLPNSKRTLLRRFGLWPFDRLARTHRQWKRTLFLTISTWLCKTLTLDWRLRWSL